MSARDLARRAVIWGVVVCYVAATTAGSIATPDAWWPAIAFCTYAAGLGALVMFGPGSRLRTEIDPAATSGGLQGAVQQTLQPAAMGLWTTGVRS